jgi:hypothetical protein
MLVSRPPLDLVVGVVGAIVAVSGWLWVLRRGQDGVRVIALPKLGILNLLGPAGSAWAADDSTALLRFFAAVRESDREPPRCDVLFVYADVGRDGAIAHSERSLRDLARDAGAQILVVASPNAAEDYVAATQPTGVTTANLVLTLDRKGPAFARFFAQLFERMHASMSMPKAWVALQPQEPGSYRPEHPDLVCLMERGHIAFQHAGRTSERSTRRRAA